MILLYCEWNAETIRTMNNFPFTKIKFFLCGFQHSAKDTQIDNRTKNQYHKINQLSIGPLQVYEATNNDYTVTR